LRQLAAVALFIAPIRVSRYWWSGTYSLCTAFAKKKNIIADFLNLSGRPHWALQSVCLPSQQGTSLE